MGATRPLRRRGIAGLVVAVVAIALTAPAAHGADAGVSVWDANGGKPRLCPPIDASDPTDLRGGCEGDMSSRPTTVVVHSVVGDLDMGACGYEHDMRVDGKGRTYLSRITPGGPNPCNDLGVCDHEDTRPWSGQIEATPDGELVHVVDACLDTCMGQFVGELRLTLRETGNGRWEQIADEALVGDTGYEIDGGWDFKGPSLDIRPEPSTGGEAAGVWRLAREPVGWPIELG